MVPTNRGTRATEFHHRKRWGNRSERTVSMSVSSSSSSAAARACCRCRKSTSEGKKEGRGVRGRKEDEVKANRHKRRTNKRHTSRPKSAAQKGMQGKEEEHKTGQTGSQHERRGRRQTKEIGGGGTEGRETMKPSIGEEKRHQATPCHAP